MFVALTGVVKDYLFLDFRLDECDLIVYKLSYLNWGALKSPFTDCADDCALRICLPSVNSAALAQFWSGIALMRAGAVAISPCFNSSSAGLPRSLRLWSVVLGETWARIESATSSILPLRT